MDANKIGEWAGIVWRLLSKENREMTFEEVMKATGLDERQLAGAIGWLAREDKIIFNAPHDGKLANLSLMLNLYIGSGYSKAAFFAVLTASVRKGDLP